MRGLFQGWKAHIKYTVSYPALLLSAALHIGMPDPAQGLVIMPCGSVDFV